jgi:guanylate kinase
VINTIVTITGASGSGKSTLERALAKRYGGGRVRTITTRPPRPGETSIDYEFVSIEELNNKTDLLWKIPIHGNMYAVARSEFCRAAGETGGLSFVCITPERHDYVADSFPDVRCIAVHLEHPGDDVLARRLTLRGENFKFINGRLADSLAFERSAAEVKNLIYIHQDGNTSQKEVFEQVVRLIEVKP